MYTLDKILAISVLFLIFFIIFVIMKNLIILLALCFIPFLINAKDVIKKDAISFLDETREECVIYDLMSDSSIVRKDTINYAEYQQKAMFLITQNQTILNRQLWAIIVLVSFLIVLVILLRKGNLLPM